MGDYPCYLEGRPIVILKFPPMTVSVQIAGHQRNASDVKPGSLSTRIHRNSVCDVWSNLDIVGREIHTASPMSDR